MKRPPERWLLPMLGILLFLHETHCLRATALIFAKTTTTTSTEAPPADDEAGQATSDPISTSNSELSADGNGTNPQLTGIPQIDYILDPNLPRELNGFNLTDYPFYEIVPKDIDFKCDGLHDGFYASVPHKCQVYHHCLFGTRYDFLCANYTAFDQKTFICHFVSEVDCANSPKYWHRNDALYKAASTTTLAPVTQRVVTTAAPVPVAPRRPVASPGGRRRRPPARRRRPQYEYYDEYDDYETGRDRYQDDYYDEPRYQATEAPRNNGRRRKRPRPNRRPEYDEYEEYEDDRYDRRGTSRRDEERRRPSKKDHRYDDDQYDDEDRRPQSDRRRPDKNSGRKPDDRPRRPIDSDYYERRPYNRNKNSKNRPRPIDDDRYDDKDDRRPYDNRRKEESDNRRRPVDNDKEDRRSYDRRKNEDDERQRYRPREEERKTEPKSDKGLVRPSSGSSVYDKPRAPPIIRRPVPKNERDKYDYKPAQSKSKPNPPQEEEYYDDYEEELPSKTTTSTTTTTQKPEPERRYKPKRIYRPNKPDYESRPSTTRKPSEESPEDLRRPLKDLEDRRKVAESRKPKPDIQSPETENIRPKRPYEQEDQYSKEDTGDTRRPNNDSRRLFRRPEDSEDYRRPNLKRPEDITDNIRRPLQDDKRPVKRPKESSDHRKPTKLPELHEDKRQRPDDTYSYRSTSQEKISDDIRRPNFKRPEDDVKRPIVELRRPVQSPPENLKHILGGSEEESEEIVVNRRPQNVPQRKPLDDNYDERRLIKRPESSETGKTKSENRFEQPQQTQDHKTDYDDYDESSQSREDYKDSREEIPTLQMPSKFTPSSSVSTSQSKSKAESPQRPEGQNKPEIRYHDKEVVNREPIVRIVKRPFLPSRGGNPYVGRGLQPIGAKAQNAEKLDNQNDAPVSESPKTSVTKDFLMGTSSEEYYEDLEGELPKSQHPVHKALPKDEPTIEDIFKPVTTRPKMDFRNIFRSEQPPFNIRPSPTAEIKTTTQKIETETYKNPLDINENEYDVTLNDALNPTIPNLPVRNVPSGFGSGSDLVNSYKKALNSRNYQYNQPYQRPRFVAIEAPLNPSGSEYIYHQVKEQIPHKGTLQSASSNPSYTYVSAPLTYQNSYQQHLAGQYYTLG